MVLYTPYDVQTVMADPNAPEVALKELSLENGITLLVSEVDAGYRIERVLSGNCNAYLMPDYQPGRVLERT